MHGSIFDKQNLRTYWRTPSSLHHKIEANQNDIFLILTTVLYLRGKYRYENK